MFGKVAKPYFLESPQKSLSKHVNIHINRATHYKIMTLLKSKKSVFFAAFFSK